MRPHKIYDPAEDFKISICAGGGKGKKKRLELSLEVGRQNVGLSAAVITQGITLPACVKAVEDHGYTVTFGIQVETVLRDSLQPCIIEGKIELLNGVLNIA